MWKSNELGKYSVVSSSVTILPDGPVQVRAVGVRVGGRGEGVAGTKEAVLVGEKVGKCVGEEVWTADGVETLGRSVAVGVNVTAVGDTTASWLDEQAASPITNNRLDANSAAVCTIFPISRECTRKLVILGKLQTNTLNKV